MANNEEKKDAVVDVELEKALKSMGDRVDPAPAPLEEDKKEVIPPVTPPEPKTEDKKDIIPDNTGSDKLPKDGEDNKNPSRPEKFIPMPKYLSEKNEWKKTESELAEARKKIEELSKIAGKKDGDQKDEDIEAFMEKTGFDRETVDGLLGLAEKRLMKPEFVEAFKKAESIVKETEIEQEFAVEFKRDGEPKLKESFPNITEEQLKKAKKFLDEVAHTSEYHDKKLDYVIFEHMAGIKEAIGETKAPETTIPQTKKTIEVARIGTGQVNGLTAKDFVDKTDFATLNDMEPATRNRLISSFDTKTYQNYYQWVKSQDSGLEVMRNGQRVILK